MNWNNQKLRTTRGQRRFVNRIMKASDGEHGGGSATDSGGVTNNTGSNSTESSAESGGTNNAGQEFDAEGFWAEPKPKTEPVAPTATTTPQTQTQDQQKEFGTQLGNMIGAIKFDGVFTNDIAEQIKEGDYSGINDAIQNQLRSAVRESLTVNAQVLSRYGQGLQTRFEQMIQDHMGTRDNNDTLLASFPSAKDPAVRPMIQSVFDQALKHSGGDRTKAVAMAKDMLKVMGPKMATDMNLTTPPGGREDGGAGNITQSGQDLLDELLGRS